MRIFKPALTSSLLTILLTVPAMAGQSDLLQQLKTATAQTAQPIARALQLEWSKSGSQALDFLMQRGRDAMEQGAWQEAIEHLSAVIDHGPEFAFAYQLRAKVFVQIGRLGLAQNDLRNALIFNPNNYESVFQLGDIFAELGDERRAKKLYQHVLLLHPHHENATKALQRLQNSRIGQGL